MLSGHFPCKAGLQRPSIGHHSYVVPTPLSIRPSLTTQVYRYNDSQGPRFHHWDMALEPGVLLVHKPMSNVIFWRLSRRMEFVASTWKTSPKPIHTQVLHTFLILFMQMKYKLDYKGFMQRFAKTLYLRRCSDKIVEVQHFTTAAPEDSHIISTFIRMLLLTKFEENMMKIGTNASVHPLGSLTVINY